MGIALRLDRTTQAIDHQGRPLSGYMTVDAAAAWMLAHDAEMPLYVEAQFSVFSGAPVSVDKQIATMTRRAKAIAAKCGRVVSRVERTNGCLYRALLAR